MKKLITICAVVVAILAIGGVAQATLVTYSGSISPSTVGGTVTTDLPMFNAGLGTLTGVQVTLNFTVTPYAQVMNFTSPTPLVFSTNAYASFGYTPANIWTVTHGTDSWNLAAPTVTTGNIYGSNQPVALGVPLIFVGGTSAPVSLTAAPGLNFAGYTGTGTLAFGTSGMGQSLISNGGRLFIGGGGNLIGTAAVTYEYEPATLVTLSSFTATAQAGRVTLEWTTASEIDNAGFNIYRAESENGEYVQINESMIPAQGSSTQGASYQIVDEGLQNRKTYYYKLEDIDLNGTATMHGPVKATPRWIFGK
ncbi:MAG: choice-of-anchor E domain-containing protein [Proteobacteria bacterium]|nr:choice-of-anchor E domain-containing protein [Pseudomonadota bacterium]